MPSRSAFFDRKTFAAVSKSAGRGADFPRRLIACSPSAVHSTRHRTPLSRVKRAHFCSACRLSDCADVVEGVVTTVKIDRAARSMAARAHALNVVIVQPSLDVKR
jgi:hypothetical protein